MQRTLSRSHGGASALWEDVQALAALTTGEPSKCDPTTLGMTLGTPSTRTRTRGALPDNRRAAPACQ